MRRGAKGSPVLFKLRKKFIALNMVCVLAAITVSFTAICIFDWKQDVAEVQQAIANSLDNAIEQHEHRGMRDYRPPKHEFGGNWASTTDASEQNDESEPQNGSDASDGDDASSNDDAASYDGAQSGALAPKIGGGQGQTIPVAVYALNAEGSAMNASPAGTANINDEVLETALSRLTPAEDSTGSFSDLGLFFEKRTIGDTTYLAFADANSAAGWKSLALTLVGAAIAALAAFFVISLFFSRWALRPVEQTWQSQRQFIADASHELKTPLTVILADASIALEHPERTVESQRQWIEGIQVEGQRMQGLVEDMLTLAKHDTAEVDAQAIMGKQQEKLDLAGMAQRAVLQFEAVAFERGVEIDAAESSSAPVFIDGVRGDIERVLGVLIDNACKYAETDGRVVVGTKREGKHAVVQVTNTGTPIPSSDLLIFSTASGAPTKRAQAEPEATVWAFPLHAASSKSTAARFPRKAPLSAEPRSPRNSRSRKIRARKAIRRRPVQQSIHNEKEACFPGFPEKQASTLSKCGRATFSGTKRAVFFHAPLTARAL